MTLIVMKTLERVYKNYYFIIRGYRKNWQKDERVGKMNMLVILTFKLLG